MNNKSNPVLKCLNLYYSYDQNKLVLDDINLTVEKSEKIGIIGPNGAGKTTLFLLISGVNKPKSGSIMFFGQSIIQGKYNSKIGMVFQNADNQLFSSTVWDDIAFGPQNLGLPPEDIKKRVMEALKITGAESLSDRAPHHLSGGEKRMVAIAGVIAMNPELILYDEPSASLDTQSRRRLINFLCDSKETQIISSHDLEFVLEVCDRVLILNDGNVISDGIPSIIMANKKLMEENGLEIPHSLTEHNIYH